MSKKFKWATVIIFVVLILDQVLKIWIKTNMVIGENSYLDWGWKVKWAQIVFIENRGMAFGMELPFASGKMILSSIRLIFIVVISYFFYKLSKKEKTPFMFLVTIGLIIAGAIGNIIDSMFYGLIFDTSSASASVPASFCSFGEGYGHFMEGKVVDMLHFPLFNFIIPEWVPFVGGSYFEFFEPVFNIADAAISVGAFLLLIFGKKWLGNDEKNEKKTDKKIETIEKNKKS